MTKSIFYRFKGLSVAKNHLQHGSAPLIQRILLHKIFKYILSKNTNLTFIKFTEPWVPKNTSKNYLKTYTDKETIENTFTAHCASTLFNFLHKGKVFFLLHFCLLMTKFLIQQKNIPLQLPVLFKHDVISMIKQKQNSV